MPTFSMRSTTSESAVRLLNGGMGWICTTPLSKESEPMTKKIAAYHCVALCSNLINR